MAPGLHQKCWIPGAAVSITGDVVLVSESLLINPLHMCWSRLFWTLRCEDVRAARIQVTSITASCLTSPQI